MNSNASDDFDDMPPPLEDMSDHLQVIKQIKENNQASTFYKSENDDEEVRLAPKKKEEQKPQSQIQPQQNQQAKTSTITPQLQKKSDPQPTQAKPAQKKQDSGFGGMKAGFLFASNNQKKPQQQQKQVVEKKTEDLTHIKAKPKEDQLKINEVQQAMTGTLLQKKDEWLNEDFFKRLASNPRLLAAFQNPVYMQAFSEFGVNPQEAMKKYGGNPEFRSILEEFSKVTGSHFETLADKKQKEEEEKMKNDPVMQIIENDPEVKSILADPRVQKVLEQLRQGGMDLYEIMRKDPPLGLKMQKLIQKGVLNVNSSL